LSDRFLGDPDVPGVRFVRSSHHSDARFVLQLALVVEGAKPAGILAAVFAGSH
jgi:hypothetical protein